MIYKERTAKRVFILIMAAVMVILVAMYPDTVQAAEPGVTWKNNISQGINSSNQYVYDGSKTDFSMPGLVLRKNDGSWGYIDKGVVRNVSGLYSNLNGWWIIENGWVNLKLTAIAKTADGSWYSFSGGKRQFTDNRTVMKNENGWWYLADGRVDFSYNGLAQNDKGVWWIEGGKVNFDKTDVVKDTGKVINDSDDWYYIDGGKVDFTANTVARNSNGWWKITNGIVDFNYCGAASNNNGIWYIQGGKVDFSFNGNAYGHTFSGGKAVN